MSGLAVMLTAWSTGRAGGEDRPCTRASRGSGTPSGGTKVVEHVTLDDAFARAGTDATTAAAVAALCHLLDKAGVMTLSTWGQVYFAEQAHGDLAHALAEFGVSAPAKALVEDRIVR